MNHQLFQSVLLIEDDPSHAVLIRRALKDYMEECTHCDSVAAALASLREREPGLIVTDLNLPDATGIDHVQRIKEAYPALPIIVLTSSTLLEDAVEAMKLGAQDFIVKNFDHQFSEVLGLSLNRVYTAQQLQLEKIRLERELSILRVAIESSTDGLAVTDRRGVARYSNRSFMNFLEMCGCERSDLTTLHPERVVRAETLRESIVANLKELQGGTVWNTDVSFVGNKDLAYHLSLFSVPDTSHEALSPQNVVVWVRDVSEQKRRERFQREILSTTTHDLKGPLGAIITGAELLTELVTGQEKASALVLRINSSAHGVVHLIDEFLSARRLEEGNFILRPKKHVLGDLMEEARDSFRTIAQARSIALDFDVHTPEAAASVDKLGFARVLGNLLSNALKFTPKGGAVRVKAWIDSDLHLEVSDTGSGIEASQVQRIFERYSRLGKHDEIEGSGIGLFVVRSIVEAHAGKIEVTSQVGLGTTFGLTFPLQPPVNERGELICLEFV